MGEVEHSCPLKVKKIETEYYIYGNYAVFTLILQYVIYFSVEDEQYHGADQSA